MFTIDYLSEEDKLLLVEIENQKEERTLEQQIMVHALKVLQQIAEDLEKQLDTNSRDPLIIAGLKDGLVEARLELEEAREAFLVAKDKEERIAEVV